MSTTPPGSPLTKHHIRPIYSHDDRKQIPVFEGKRGKPLVHTWLEDAERVAQSSSWTPSEKVKYFADRLRCDASDWHKTYIASAQLPDDYELWEKAFIERFLTKADRENLKKELFKLRQGEQSTQTFVSRLNKLYDTIHGKEITIDLHEVNLTTNTKQMYDSLYLIRSKAKTDILIKGLQNDIKNRVWERINPNTVYEDVCDLAYAAEIMVNRMDMVAGVSTFDC